ncbi:TRAP transporter substrate-binding protein [Hoeflea sp. EC-HK425]|jgi:TRAP-type C4-dicarboxylate transport system substrate-binding protein|uniref:TRAP transporter substrate-binding protein n=1 Tax=Hoeflea sp. EC-HK425 TaxID=2038388 RepID=UPI00125422AA|nr:TRAP transporter substrate-binding protein [Hoeflea sp. EC-HK425]VVT27909.1 C4-dicarboxylate ABC transporter substrate-binding protein [Hoeflea sp. EC-HK425]|tara:strand:- start:21 stop:1031 length:1011 start_codon:yes stop_codon:yes gene_type:complete
MKVLLLAAGTAAALVASNAYAADFNLRMQTQYGAETVSGKLAQRFIDNVEAMSGGRVAIEMFWSSSVVATVEGFDAAASGILDGEMHGGAYQTGKNPAFQFVGDPMGGYDTPYELYSFFYFGGGQEAANALYEAYNMHLVGWWTGGQESLSSSKPLRGPEDLKGWKFRSPPGLETEIFAELGASPIVMDFTEVFTSLETGIIDGADASSLANNVGLGLYDLVNHATYPGFHSMPVDHVTFNLDVWNSFPDDIKAIFEVATQALALQTAMTIDVANAEAATKLKQQGVNLYDWSAEDRAAFRAGAQRAWDGWADKTPEAKALVEAHRTFLRQTGKIE